MRRLECLKNAGSGDNGFDPENVSVDCEVGIMSPEYGAEILKRSDIN